MLSSRREIPSASFQLHAVHCARNITLCTRCDEPIPRAEFEEHMETVHRQLECDTGCGARMEVGKMEDHKVSTDQHHVECGPWYLVCFCAGSPLPQAHHAVPVVRHSRGDGAADRARGLLRQQDREVREVGASSYDILTRIMTLYITRCEEYIMLKNFEGHTCTPPWERRLAEMRRPSLSSARKPSTIANDIAAIGE